MLISLEICVNALNFFPGRVNERGAVFVKGEDGLLDDLANLYLMEHVLTIQVYGILVQ